jgi:iron complex outermembrane receptor protein
VVRVLKSGVKGVRKRAFSKNALSMTVLSAALASALCAVPERPAFAQATEKRYVLKIGQVMLAEGLGILQRATEARLVFAPAQLRAITTKGLDGEFTVAEALARLLDGSGFQAQMAGGGTYVIVNVAPPEAPRQAQAAPSPAKPPISPPPGPRLVQSDGSMVEIVVTAQRREESIQRVPISIQALTPKILKDRKIVNFDDYAKLLPSVSFRSLGPGRTDVFFRGITTGGSGLPTTGMYIDDTPVQTPGRLLDIHLYDIARVEALSGPQGTLFGANSLAGTLRVITNKPDPTRYLAGVDVQANKFSAGDFGGMVEGFINIPVADDSAVRMVAFYDRAGGYVDNKPASITYQLGDNDPATQLTVNNYAIAKDNINTVETLGGRLAGVVNLGERWTVTPQFIFQQLNSEGDFLYLPRAGDLSVNNFSLTGNRDKWLLSSSTIEGDLGVMDVIYSASYLSRQISSQNDYTYYSVAYDALPGYTRFPDGRGGWINPTQTERSAQRNRKMTHELRATSSAQNRGRLTGGAFYQKQDNLVHTDYAIPGFSTSPGIYAHVPSPVYADDIYLIYTHSTLLDYAIFADGSYALTDDITITGGVRFFGYESGQVGFNGTFRTALRAGCALPLPNPQSCITRDNFKRGSGETHKINGQWQIDPDKMVYLTYSTGYRPGGFNYTPGVKPFDPDTLDNVELGYKTTWNNTLRLNGAFYFEKWNGLQYRIVVPGNNGSVGVYNAGEAEVWGAEFDATWLVNDSLTLSAAGSYNNARLSSDICNLDATFNQLQSCAPGVTTIATKGVRLPFQPKFKMSAVARYEVPLGLWDAYAQAAMHTQTSTTNDIRVLQNGLFGDNAGFSTFDVSLGGTRDDTTVEFFVQNIFDKRGALSRATFCAIEICQTSARPYPIKPQFFGVKVSRRFF